MIPVLYFRIHNYLFVLFPLTFRNPDNNGAVWQLQDRINQLEAELAEARSRIGTMGVSVAVESSWVYSI